jgi:6-pyruvoyltetrahydropterin/6-carboxytetrahydropterin synthase
LFTVSIETRFSAAHQLTLADGSKEPLHEHDWLVTASVGSDRLNSMGVVIDFHMLKEMVESVVGQLADNRLGRTEHFKKNNPSAEVVARYIYEKLETIMPKNVKLEHVKVVEEPGCWAKFSK